MPPLDGISTDDAAAALTPLPNWLRNLPAYTPTGPTPNTFASRLQSAVGDTLTQAPFGMAGSGFEAGAPAPNKQPVIRPLTAVAIPFLTPPYPPP